LVAIGFVLFLIAAGQIYWAKFRRSGLVTQGFYRFVRHPQYIALTLFGVGILLTWGRAITFLAFFLMMFLYYYLAKSEERNCIRLFGDAYERYRKRTSFIIPGDRLLRPLSEKMPRLHLPAPVRVSAAFIVSLAICLAAMWLINAVKVALRTTPYLMADISFGSTGEAITSQTFKSGHAGVVPFVEADRLAVARGPYRNAAAAGFAERALARLRQSKALTNFLAFLNEPGGDVAIVFCGPFEQPETPGQPGARAGERGPLPDPAGPDRVRLVIMRCALAPGASIADALADKSKRQIRGGCIAPVNLATREGEDIVEGEAKTAGPKFPGEQRWDFFLQQFAAQPSPAPASSSQSIQSGGAHSAQLLVVQAPILRTRLDQEFAADVLDRLKDSPKFRERLRMSGTGGNTVAVAFPRPGLNWYREHHGQPQVSVFVMIARRKADAPISDLFRPGGRALCGAFTAEMDFKIEPPEDCIGEISVIGPRRDLEERWHFFLSGLGGMSILAHDH
ncbi:MAG: isoprenylcysteine carboxylmethyltransferase family protein, partial [Candidatus Sumerlaeota bacterium]|nr:isoprenylcysteine carboxylmethyltransferase family protein [Candidatus Sumerlaeota bacterium]